MIVVEIHVMMLALLVLLPWSSTGEGIPAPTQFYPYGPNADDATLGYLAAGYMILPIYVPILGGTTYDLHVCIYRPGVYY